MLTGLFELQSPVDKWKGGTKTLYFHPVCDKSHGMFWQLPYKMQCLSTDTVACWDLDISPSNLLLILSDYNSCNQYLYSLEVARLDLLLEEKKLKILILYWEELPCD